ncbi:MAG: hypothetical protein WC446_01090 [Candidatus Paceibacterota bacterium]|jgi:hypothetical protein
MKKYIFLILISFFFCFPVTAASYPVIGGIDINSPEVTASQFIVYLFYLVTAIGSVLGVIVLIIAGLEWVSAYGDAKTINSAKKKIITVFSGLALLFSSYIIINTINPAILNINIEKKEGEFNPVEFVIPEGKGIFLYPATNFETSEDPLNIRESRVSLISDGFYKKTSSIKINNPDEMTLGAILFADKQGDEDGKIITGTEFKGRCTYITGDIADLGSSSGDQNSPPIGQNSLASLIVFDGSPGGQITIYNNYNCQNKTNKYCREEDDSDDWVDPFPCPEPEEYSCTFRVDKFTSLEEILKTNCTSGEKSFKGDILSIKVSGRAAVLFRGLLIKDNEEGPEETCQYIDSKNTGCINMIKYGSFYKMIEGENQSVFSPKEIMVFSLN